VRQPRPLRETRQSNLHRRRLKRSGIRDSRRLGGGGSPKRAPWRFWLILILPAQTHRRRPVGDFHLLQNVLDVLARGGTAYSQGTRDLLVGGAGAEEFEHFSLAPGQLPFAVRLDSDRGQSGETCSPPSKYDFLFPKSAKNKYVILPIDAPRASQAASPAVNLFPAACDLYRRSPTNAPRSAESPRRGSTNVAPPAAMASRTAPNAKRSASIGLRSPLDARRSAKHARRSPKFSSRSAPSRIRSASKPGPAISVE
jgi:hypothetical protein